MAKWFQNQNSKPCTAKNVASQIKAVFESGIFVKGFLNGKKKIGRELSEKAKFYPSVSTPFSFPFVKNTTDP